MSVRPPPDLEIKGMTTEAAAARYLAEHLFEHSGKTSLVFNPKGVDDVNSLPAIYCFSAVEGGGKGVAYAVAADGTVLGSHWCSNEGYVRADLGVVEGWRMDRHEGYQKHYPDGYRMEFVRAADVDEHTGLQNALAKHRKAEKERCSEA